MPRSDTDLDLPRLGQALRRRRKLLGKTMQIVAERAGVSVGLISQVERGLTKPSLATLDALAGALGMRAGHLLDEALADPLRTGRASERVLSDPAQGGAMWVAMRQIPPGAPAPDRTHPGEEFVFVLSGCVTLRLDGVETVLGVSDSRHYDSGRPHGLWNHTDGVATILLARCASAPLPA